MNITSTDYSLTPSIKNKINGFELTLKKYFDATDEVQIVLSKESPDQFRVDIQAYAFGKTIRSKVFSHNFHKAFKLGSEHFVISLKKAKSIFQGRHRAQPEKFDEI